MSSVCLGLAALCQLWGVDIKVMEMKQTFDPRTSSHYGNGEKDERILTTDNIRKTSTTDSESKSSVNIQHQDSTFYTGIAGINSGNSSGDSMSSIGEEASLSANKRFRDSILTNCDNRCSGI